MELEKGKVYRWENKGSWFIYRYIGTVSNPLLDEGNRYVKIRRYTWMALSTLKCFSTPLPVYNSPLYKAVMGDNE
jgi:hypothetical protein